MELIEPEFDYIDERELSMPVQRKPFNSISDVLPDFLKHTTAEHSLLVAILERSIRDYLWRPMLYAYRGTERTSEAARLKTEAIEWLFDGSEEPFSLRWVCEQLCLEPEQLLDRLEYILEELDNTEDVEIEALTEAEAAYLGYQRSSLMTICQGRRAWSP